MFWVPWRILHLYAVFHESFIDAVASTGLVVVNKVLSSILSTCIGVNEPFISSSSSFSNDCSPSGSNRHTRLFRVGVLGEWGVFMQVMGKMKAKM